MLSKCREKKIKILYDMCKDAGFSNVMESYSLILNGFLVLQAELFIKEGSGYFFINTSVPNIVRVTHEETRGIALVSEIFCYLVSF